MVVSWQVRREISQVREGLGFVGAVKAVVELLRQEPALGIRLA